MALSKNGNSGVVSGPIAGAWQGILRRHEERRLHAALAGKPDRLIRDMGLEPTAFDAQPWAYELGPVQAIGNRP